MDMKDKTCAEQSSKTQYEVKYMIWLFTSQCTGDYSPCIPLVIRPTPAIFL